MAAIQEIASALCSIATPAMKPKALRSAIKARYPDATKKEIVRAAFYAVAEAAPAGQDTHSELHNFALTQRISGDNADEVLRVGKLKKKRNLEADSQSMSQ